MIYVLLPFDNKKHIIKIHRRKIYETEFYDASLWRAGTP
jgi:hypothetical protein